jgi:hypothetical protein
LRVERRLLRLDADVVEGRAGEQQTGHPLFIKLVQTAETTRGVWWPTAAFDKEAKRCMFATICTILAGEQDKAGQRSDGLAGLSEASSQTGTGKAIPGDWERMYIRSVDAA